MPFLLNFVLRLVLVAVGLCVALAIATAAVLLLAAWLLRAAWCKLTGQPVHPFVVRMGPGRAFEEMMRRAPRRPTTAPGLRPRALDATDVEPK